MEAYLLGTLKVRLNKTLGCVLLGTILHCQGDDLGDTINILLQMLEALSFRVSESTKYSIPSPTPYTQTSVPGAPLFLQGWEGPPENMTSFNTMGWILVTSEMGHTSKMKVNI